MSLGRFGWTYLVVTRTPLPDSDGQTHRALFAAVDMGAFASEPEMLSELGATGWELIAIRDAPSTMPGSASLSLYYFKRPRT